MSVPRLFGGTPFSISSRIRLILVSSRFAASLRFSATMRSSSSAFHHSSNRRPTAKLLFAQRRTRMASAWVPSSRKP